MSSGNSQSTNHRPTSSLSFFSRSPNTTKRSHFRNHSATDAMAALSLDSPPSTPTPRSSLCLQPTPEATSSLSRKTGRRSVSRVERWVEEQHAGPNAKSARRSAAGFAHYMAYPDLLSTARTIVPEEAEDATSFVLIVDDATEDETGTVAADEGIAKADRRLHLGHTRLSSPSLRNLRNPLTSVRRHLSASPAPPAPIVSSLSPPSSPRVLLPRPSTSMSFSSHRRADSASSVNVSMSSSPHASSTALHAGTSPARSLRAPWKLRRPNLFTTFGDQSTLEAHEIPLPDSPSPPLQPNTPPLIGGASPYVDTPSRPSFTSSRTVSSTATTELLTPSSRAASRSAHTPSGSMWSLPVDASHMFDPPDSEVTIAKDPARKSLFSRPSTYTLRGIIPFAALPRKILVVSGIAPGEDYRLDALLVWCEGFGEVKEVSRAPNGDIHIDFKKTEVADTVCRLNAHVEIVGVGSVALNWKTMKKR